MPFVDWVNKNTAKEAAHNIPIHLLQQEATYGDTGGPHSDNLLIQGDNLLALKALMPVYAGRIKCIFIDPPYNTQSAFEHYDDKLEHSQWLSMMYPRLVLLRELLSEDGSIWVTLDDSEAHYCKVLMDEVFGRNNFVADIFWQKNHTRENRTDISTVHDHVFVTTKDRDRWAIGRNMLPPSESQLARFTNEDGDHRGPWASLPEHAKAEKGRRAAQFFTITTPSGRKVDRACASVGRTGRSMCRRLPEHSGLPVSGGELAQLAFCGRWNVQAGCRRSANCGLSCETESRVGDLGNRTFIRECRRPDRHRSLTAAGVLPGLANEPSARCGTGTQATGAKPTMGHFAAALKSGH